MSTNQPRSLMSEERCMAYAREWIDAWNSHDLDRIMSHYAEGLEFTSPLVLHRCPDLDGAIHDLDRLRAYFSVSLHEGSTLAFKLVEVLRGVNGFCMYYANGRGGHTAEYVEIDENDKATKVIVCRT